MKEINKISSTKARHILITLGLAMFLVVIVIPSSTSYAQRRVKPEIMLPNHYPNGFDGYGRLQRLGQEEVVIDDILRKLSPNVEYHTKTKMNASRAYFRPGVLAGFLTNSDGEIVSLWLVE